MSTATSAQVSPGAPADLRDLDGLAHDPRASLADRLALRTGLWLLLYAEHRVRRLEERGRRRRSAAVREATAEEQYASHRQNAYLMMLYHG
ncbi:hypothetical protein [Microbacterium sp.]|uniref:hypothetical protein n=1 Tax=Microbacterium sp. TaxID=51671 RepID=UPI003A8EA613